MGTPEFSVPALDGLAEAGHDIAAVYTQPPRPAGRGKRPRPSPVAARAQELGLTVRHPESLRAEEAQQAFAALQAEAAVVVAYGLILPQPVLDAPARGCLNIHASLLPRWRGAAPIHRAIMAGDEESGVCIMQMEAGLDTGPVLMCEATEIGPQETTADLHDRLSIMGAGLIEEVLLSLDYLKATPQPGTGVTYAAKIDKSEARVNWNAPADQVDRLIRGLSPFPGAWCDIDGERVKLLRSRVAGAGDNGAPGQVLRDLTVACGSGAVTITQVQRQGKKPMDSAEFLRGATLPAFLA